MWVPDTIVMQFAYLIGLVVAIVFGTAGFCGLLIMISEMFIPDGEDKDNE